MKKIVFTLLALALVCQSADAQFFKKLFKKKAKTEAKAPVAADGIDDDAQLALADIASCSDNRNNRNAFLNIPLGIKADRFEKQLLQQGFVERKNEGAQTSKTYYYEGEVYGAKSLITLAVSEQTGRVYAVDVEDQTVYPSEQAVKQRFASLKKELVKVYGGGFIDKHLGLDQVVGLHVDRLAVGGGYCHRFGNVDFLAIHYLLHHGCRVDGGRGDGHVLGIAIVDDAAVFWQQVHLEYLCE